MADNKSSFSLDPVSLGISAIQGVTGLIDKISGTNKVDDLTNQLTPYKSPEEIQKILDFTLSQAGGDTATRDYQTGEINQAFAAATGVAERLGANPNDLSAILQQKIRGIMKVGQEFHASNMEEFSKIYGAYNLVADNRAAEWKSQQDMLKDKIAAAGGQVQAGYANISGGINTALASIQSSKTQNLFNNNK